MSQRVRGLPGREDARGAGRGLLSVQPTEDTKSGTWHSEVARWAGTPQVGTAPRMNALGLSR